MWITFKQSNFHKKSFITLSDKEETETKNKTRTAYMYYVNNQEKKKT